MSFIIRFHILEAYTIKSQSDNCSPPDCRHAIFYKKQEKENKNARKFKLQRGIHLHKGKL